MKVGSFCPCNKSQGTVCNRRRVLCTSEVVGGSLQLDWSLICFVQNYWNRHYTVWRTCDPSRQDLDWSSSVPRVLTSRITQLRLDLRLLVRAVRLNQLLSSILLTTKALKATLLRSGLKVDGYFAPNLLKPLINTNWSHFTGMLAPVGCCTGEASFTSCS